MSLFEENAAILRKIEADGNDLTLPRLIDFSHILPDGVSAKTFAQEAEAQGFSISVSESEVELWDVTASKEMPLNCKDITDIEKRLDTLARAYNGHSDGWGFFNV